MARNGPGERTNLRVEVAQKSLDCPTPDPDPHRRPHAGTGKYFYPVAAVVAAILLLMLAAI